MSRPIDPLQPRPPLRAAGRQRVVHRQGELLGLRYELGIRVSDLAPPEAGQPAELPIHLTHGSRT